MHVSQEELNCFCLYRVQDSIPRGVIEVWLRLTSSCEHPMKRHEEMPLLLPAAQKV